MSLHTARQLVLGFHVGRPVVLEASAAQLSSDAGLLVVREFDERIGVTAQFAAALRETRDARFTQHELLSMVRQRIYRLLADYEDQNDHDELRSDPVFRLIAGRLPEDRDLASQPTLSRFENAVTKRRHDPGSTTAAGVPDAAVPRRVRGRAATVPPSAARSAW